MFSFRPEPSRPLPNARLSQFSPDSWLPSHRIKGKALAWLDLNHLRVPSPESAPPDRISVF
ncbi:hypothetical protein SBA6_900005 [Candidatus Sulfopaludibacter sp. SbA6]|nr:hypothetical protein SBA6_900005 [Candidatus Sulfopaludibacter sp. SbA6]